MAQVIREALGVFVADDPNCLCITFKAIPDDGTLLPGVDYRADISPNPIPAAPYRASITLVCRTEIPAGVNSSDPPADGGEAGPEHPNI